MSSITAELYGALIVYLGGWFLGQWTGNFSLLLFMLTLVTLVYWVAERFKFKPAREAAAAQLSQHDAARRAELGRMGIDKIDGDVEQARAALLAQPWWLDWTAGLFPVILVVFVLRSFLFEPFKIPSGSMIPTLLVGDLILVNKYTYGLKLPVANTRITQGNPIQRGDVVVFRYPPKPSMDYIKRVIGLPGDEVSYLNKRLTINGQPVPEVPVSDFFDETMMEYFKQFEEELPGKKHRIIVDPRRAAFIAGVDQFQYKENCNYSVEGVTCKVPEGHYFMMGDNRDNSLDSRYWGFVPDANVVGKAFFVWMNFGDLKRIGSFN